MLKSLSHRLAVSVLAVSVGVGIAACDGGPAEDPPPPPVTTTTVDSSSAAPTAASPSSSTSPPASSSAPTSPSAPAPSVAPNDKTILEGLAAQGYQCEGATRCRRVKNNLEEVIEVGPGRAVFVVKATRGTSADLGAALTSVLDDYGSVLPQRSFAGTDWEQFTTWADKHLDDNHANGTVAGWHAILQAGGPKVRKLVLTLP